MIHEINVLYFQVKLAGFTELLKVRAAEAKMPYPTR